MSEKGQDRQGEIEAFNTEVKSLPLFDEVINQAGEALCEWYHLERKEIPCLDPERIEFVSDKEFLGFETEDKVGDTLVNQALRLVGVKPEIFPGKRDFKTAVNYANPFRHPLTIYFRQSIFESLLNEDPKNQLKTALTLGFNLIEISLSLLPKLRETHDPELIKLSITRLLEFFQQTEDLTLNGAKAEDLKKAQEVFRELLEDDPTRKTLLYGAQIILAFEEGGVLKSQFPTGERFDGAITHFLADQPERKFARWLITERLYSLSLRSKEEREKGISEVKKFLGKLGLKDYWSVFNAYKESRIPEIFLERLKVKPDLEYPS